MTAPAAEDGITRPALMLVIGRAVGLVASFAIGLVLVRVFDPADFGTYKQFFLVYATLYGLAQLGMAESLYYFVPRKGGSIGRYVSNAAVTLAAAGLGCVALLYAMRSQIAERLTNPALADYMVLLGLFLTLTLVSTVLEILMVSRKQHLTAAVTYAASDIGRTILFVAPALIFGSLRAVFIGGVIFAGLRLALMLAALRREFGEDMRIDLALWRSQLAYALPFALAVGIEVIQVNYHQYIVASQFDAATFAIYAVGCMSIPLVDTIMTSTVNVLMVKMAEDAGNGRMAMHLWHDTVTRLAFLLCPLAAFLVVLAHPFIVTLYTDTYAASAPIFMVWSLAILPTIFAVDAVLRVYAQTRFLLFMNILRLGLVAVSIGWFLSTFGLAGAVLVTLLTTCLVKGIAVVRIARLMQVTVAEVLPWGRLAAIALRACAAGVPAWWIVYAFPMSPLAALVAGGSAYGVTYVLLSYAPGIAEPTAPALPFVRRLFTARPSPRIAAPYGPLPEEHSSEV